MSSSGVGFSGKRYLRMEAFCNLSAQLKGTADRSEHWCVCQGEGHIGHTEICVSSSKVGEAETSKPYDPRHFVLAPL